MSLNIILKLLFSAKRPKSATNSSTINAGVSRINLEFLHMLGPMVSAEHECIMRSGGRAPSWGQGAKPLEDNQQHKVPFRTAQIVYNCHFCVEMHTKNPIKNGFPDVRFSCFMGKRPSKDVFMCECFTKNSTEIRKRLVKNSTKDPTTA